MVVGHLVRTEEDVHLGLHLHTPPQVDDSLDAVIQQQLLVVGRQLMQRIGAQELSPARLSPVPGGVSADIPRVEGALELQMSSRVQFSGHVKVLLGLRESFFCQRIRPRDGLVWITRRSDNWVLGVDETSRVPERKRSFA